MCSDAPDPDPLIGQSALANAKVSADALAWYKQKDAAGKPRQDKLDAVAMELADQQINTSKVNTQQAEENWARYKAVGMPAEDAMYKDAREYDTQDRRDTAVGEAATDVDFALNGAMDAKRRNMMRAGVNPADGRALSMEQDGATSGALAKATAMNGARTRIKDMGIMLRKDAANFAKGMQGNAAQSYGVAAQAGAGATGALTAAGQMANQSTQTNGAGFGTAISGNNSAGSMLNQEYGNRVQAAGQGGLGAIAGAAGQLGAGLGAMGVTFSDENMKEEIAPIDPDAALNGIAKTKVKSWKYKGDSPAADGGQRHIGAMAQDMQKHLGDEVAPGGKIVDIISALGVNMAATKALNAKVEKMLDGKKKGGKA
jgi:hypothetical protein